jgi:predicted enzyme related to lactoylglutathione lyase
MINGAHFLLYSTNAEADRAFFRDVLEFKAVDSGRGWLIFGLPPTEIAVHPSGAATAPPNAADGVTGAALYLMCADLHTTMAKLRTKNVNFSPIEEPAWGTVTTIPLPSGACIGLYQPKHPTALGLGT